MRATLPWFPLGMMIVLLSACATVTPRPTNLASSALLRPTRVTDTPYHYRRPGINFTTYDSVLMAPVKSAVDSSSASLLPAEALQLTDELQRQFTSALSQRFRIVAAPGSRTLMVQLTLIDARKSNAALSTITHALPVGIVVNAGAQLAGRHGTFTGSVVYAVEARDAESGDILYAEVAHRSADALNIAAGFTPLAAAKAGIEHGARSFAKVMTESTP